MGDLVYRIRYGSAITVQLAFRKYLAVKAFKAKVHTYPRPHTHSAAYAFKAKVHTRTHTRAASRPRHPHPALTSRRARSR